VGTQGQSEGPGTELPQKFLIVGIGGSAGGLEALEKFFANVPAKSGMAFVVIQHLAPHHVSILAELLGRTARIPIVLFAILPSPASTSSHAATCSSISRPSFRES
jgi:two-component system CheB/CheR fusion protein